jgi:hypothetical protein
MIVLSAREEIAVRLAEAMLSSGAPMTTAAGTRCTNREICLHAIECADAMIEKFVEKDGGSP